MPNWTSGSKVFPCAAGLCAGSGGAALAEALDLPYVQEVVANSLAVGANYPTARTAIELGGQDAEDDLLQIRQ